MGKQSRLNAKWKTIQCSTCPTNYNYPKDWRGYPRWGLESMNFAFCLSLRRNPFRWENLLRLMEFDVCVSAVLRPQQRCKIKYFFANCIMRLLFDARIRSVQSRQTRKLHEIINAKVHRIPRSMFAVVSTVSAAWFWKALCDLSQKLYLPGKSGEITFTTHVNAYQTENDIFGSAGMFDVAPLQRQLYTCIAAISKSIRFVCIECAHFHASLLKFQAICCSNRNEKKKLVIGRKRERQKSIEFDCNWVVKLFALAMPMFNMVDRHNFPYSV